MNPATASHSFLLLSLRYEDISKGLISEGRFATFSVSLENEQKQLKETIPALETELEATTDKVAALQHFIEQARKVTRLTELTPEIVHEFYPNILQDPAKPCGTAHNAAFPDSKPPQLLRIYYQGMSIDTTKHREMRTYGFAPPFELPLKITYRPTG